MSVDIWWHQLVMVTPLLSYSTFVLCTGLVFEDLEVDENPILAQSSHDGLVSLQVMLFLAIIERGNKNCVGIEMIGNHEILVATLRLDRSAYRVISIYFTDVHRVHVKFVRLLGGKGRIVRGGRRDLPSKCLGLGG